MFQWEPCSSTSWVIKERWQGFTPSMEPLTGNGKGRISSSVLLLSVAPGRRHWALAVNHCHPFESWQVEHSPRMLVSESTVKENLSSPKITQLFQKIFVTFLSYGSLPIPSLILPRSLPQTVLTSSSLISRCILAKSSLERTGVHIGIVP